MADYIKRGTTWNGWYKGLAVAVVFCMLSDAVWAASAFAYDSTNVVFGHGVAGTLTKAKQKARENCIANGGNPGTVTDESSSVAPGWGAACISEQVDGRKVSSVTGYPTKRKAKRRAKRLCKDIGGVNCQIVDVVHDNG